MELIIVLRKAVTSEEEAQQLITIVKTWLEDKPSVDLTASVTNRLEPPDV